MNRLLVALVALVFTVPLAGQAPAASGVLGFYRQPALHGETIVFVAEGDLWTVPVRGGLARRLTSHPADESDPVISPDGKTVAFTGRYEGPGELYTMPLTGGSPIRQSWESETSRATTWTPSGEVVYTTTHYATLPNAEMVRLDPATHVRRRIPLTGATEGNYDTSGHTIYFARPGFHNNVTKRYTGGTARQIWKFQDGDTEATRLTNGFNGESHSPMWYNGRVYFVTARDGTMNLWSMTESGSDLTQLTHHSGWDVMDPDQEGGRIVYQLGADLWMYDIATNQSRQLSITIASDLDQLRERWVSDPMSALSSVHLSPTGDRVVLTSRGRVFVAPAGQGRLVRASRADSVRYRDAVFTADGKGILALSDATGELEFTRLPANGVGRDSAITHDGTVLRFQGVPSADGAWLAFTDNNRDLWLRNLASGSERKLSTNRNGIGDVVWSPDSHWLAFSVTAANTFQVIMLYGVDRQETVTLTTDRTNSFAPAWDPKGAFIYFLSDRNLRTSVGGPWGPRQPEPYFDKSIEIYQVALRAGVRSPFLPDDELHPGDRDSSSAKADSAGKAKPDSGAAPRIRIDTADLARRIRKVPVASGNYFGLEANRDGLFWVAQGDSGSVMALAYANHDIEPVMVADGVDYFELSRDGQKMLLRRGNALHVIGAKPARAGKLVDARVDLTGWSFPIDVRQDWRQIFIDAWRLERDWFYDPNLHGVDYQATLDKYLPLVDRVTTRAELSEVIGWAVGELSALHTAVYGGDLRRGPDNIAVASLGARLFRDPAAGGYRIEHIYQHDPDYPDDRSPLADPDLDIATGDVITAVNGTSALSVGELGELLRNQSGRQVLLTVARNGTARDRIVTPIGNESGLRYTDWEVSRRERTEVAGKGAIGYVHLRAMTESDINDWYREFYPIFNRQGLIIDVRHNRGGNIESFILEKLQRTAWMYWQERAGDPTWNMQYAFRGHIVVLVDQETASDGEAFAEGFKRLGLGKVIGARTWGGEIWLSSNNTLTDGGLARAPMMGVYGPDGKWLVEQEGVIPDIEVDNLPHATYMGGDAQLDRAIAELQAMIAADPRPVPPPPAYPVKRFAYP
ncbi:MAG: S41 family peptidase [Gemmatimonadota bacterium]